MKTYNKLVRDNIPDIIIKNGETPTIKFLNDTDYVNLLELKLLEEVNEYLEDKNIEELADIYEVYLAILKSKNIEIEEVINVATRKREKNGGFDKKIYLESVK